MQCHAWEMLTTAMSLGGLCPISDKATNMSISENVLKVIVSNSKMVRYEFEKLYVQMGDVNRSQPIMS